jgi:hypothetical protein
MKEYSTQTPITSGIEGCSGRCVATVRAPALIPYHCVSNVTWKNFSAPYTQSEEAVFRKGSVPTTRKMFESSLTSKEGEMETLDFHTIFTGDEVAKTCAGRVNSTHCYLRSAIADYKVIVTDGTITLNDPANPTFISWANNTAITKETINQFSLREQNASAWIKTTLSGVVAAFSFEFAFSGFAYPPKPSRPGSLDLMVPSTTWFMYQETTNFEQYNNNKACAFAWKDPRRATMAGLNELMFRTGIHVANNYDQASLKGLLDPGVQINYTGTGTFDTPIAVLKSDFTFYFAAAALELLTIGLVLSTFYGYWRLGRDVSFSPLEIAKVCWS